MGDQRMTVREIAELAGVSIATVSRVSRGNTRVDPELRDRVLATIRQHDYRPSHFGRALAEGRHGAFGLVFPGLAGPYYAELIQGFESEAVEAGASVHIVGTHKRAGAEEQVVAMATRVDGVAVLGGTLSGSSIEALARTVPTVIMAGGRCKGVVSVRVDNRRSMHALVLHLLRDHGHRELRFVGDPRGSPDVTERWQAFLAAHRDTGIPAPKRPVRVGLAQHDGVIAADLIFRERRAPDAVVCANDETALGVIMAALGRRLRVPADVAITGYDDGPMASLVRPTLTTVRQPVRELAATSMHMLLALSRAPRAAPGQLAAEAAGIPADTVLETELVIRASCGCPEGTA